MAKPSWSGSGSLADALAAIERSVQARGHHARQSSFSAASLDALASRIGGLPDDLREFLGWYDHQLWSLFVNPQQAMWSQTLNVITRAGERIVEGHPSDRLFDLYGVVDDLSSITRRRLSESDDHHVQAFLEDFEFHWRPRRWRDTTVIFFGTSTFFEPILYAVDPPDLSQGSIITFNTDTTDRVWLADSLAQWLRRLAACGGIEYAFAPGDVNKLPQPVRREYMREFRARNPTSEFFQPWWKRCQGDWLRGQIRRAQRVLRQPRAKRPDA